MIDKNTIVRIINELSFVDSNFIFGQENETVISFTINIHTQEGRDSLPWLVCISHLYPLKTNGNNSISFTNKDLLEYPHIMKEGNLCLHTIDALTTQDQFRQDLFQLKNWVEKYYVNEEKDDHFDNLVVDPILINNSYYYYLFTETDKEIPIGDYGHIRLNQLGYGLKDEKQTVSHIVCGFKSEKIYHANEILCKWSKLYTSKSDFRNAIYCMISDIPANYNKFIVDNYLELEHFLTLDQKNFIYRSIRENKQKNVSMYTLMCGYKTPDDRTFWQALILDPKNLPMTGEKIHTQHGNIWNTIFLDYPIQWAHSIDSSYEYFFGRGAMPQDIANKKIFIIGIGAIGSMVAKTLARCGAKQIDVYDYDIKEPGNICRSEYEMMNGIGNKMFEMTNILNRISPFIDCNQKVDFFDCFIKGLGTNNDNKENIEEILNEYDVIFDCTTDNHLMVLLDDFNLRPQVINISITNHAKELVCAFSPKITDCINFLYNKLLIQDTVDMFNPSGCWNPTFKASYNDISIIVQFAIKHIIMMLEAQEPMANFYIHEKGTSLVINKL